MAWSRIAHVEGASAGGGSGFSFAARNTIGSDLNDVKLGWYTPGGAPTVTDSRGNTYVKKTTRSSTNLSTAHFVCEAPTNDAALVITVTSTGGYPGGSAEAWSGSLGAGATDQDNGASTAGATSLTSGSVTPAAGSLVLSCIVFGTTGQLGNLTVDSGFSAIDGIDYSTGVSEGIGAASKQSSSTESPKWDWAASGSLEAAVSTITFKPASGSGTTIAIPVGSIGLVGRTPSLSIGVGGSVYGLQARSGIERAGASRSGYFIPNVIFTIGGVDVTSKVLWDNPAPSITLQINDQPTSASFSLRPGSGVTVTAGQLVTIALGSVGNVEFGGQVLTVTQRVMTTKAGPIIFQHVHCIDYGRLLARRIVNAEFVNSSVTDIANSLIDDWSTGFSRASVAFGLDSIGDFVANNDILPSVFTRLANLIDGGWLIDAAREIHLFGSAGDPSTRGWTTNPLTLTATLKTFFGGSMALSFASDVSQQRTRAIVEGKSTTCPIGMPGPMDSADVDWLVVGRGGDGSGQDLGNGGGGGGGEVRIGTDRLTPGSYPVVVGVLSSFHGHAAKRGATASASGGSSPYDWSYANPDGFPGGAIYFDGTHDNTGGGASPAAMGGDASISVAGVGATGVVSSISGSPVTYGSGGGGASASDTHGAGGTGAGSGGATGGNATTPGSGGGGSVSGPGGLGANGIVIISYTTGALDATGGTITTSGGKTIHTLTATDTFTINQPAPAVGTGSVTATDIPLSDKTQIDAAAGLVRIGNQVVSYLSTGGASIAAGATNPPGSTASSDVAAGATAIPVADSTQFTASPGWAQAGDQIVRFASISGGALQGIPATGFGALAAAIKSGTSVTWLGHLNLSAAGTAFSPPVAKDAQVVQRTIVDDGTAQAATAAIEGGDGVHEYLVPETELTLSGAAARGAAEVADFGAAIESATWETEDMNARAGRMQTFGLTGIPAATLLITSVTITFIKKNTLPRRRCEAASVHTAALLDAVVTSK